MRRKYADLLSDFFFTKGNVFPELLFNPTRTNPRYRYNKGFNLQAIIAYLFGVALPFPGFVQSLGATGVSVGGQRLFDLGWLLSFFVSFVVYLVICKVWPTKNQVMIREEGIGWEQHSKTLFTVHPASEDDLEDAQVVDKKALAF